MFAVFRLLPPQGGESVAPYQAFGAHPLMQITEMLHIMHCSKSLYTNITPFFSSFTSRSFRFKEKKTNPTLFFFTGGGSLSVFFFFFFSTPLKFVGVVVRGGGSRGERERGVFFLFSLRACPSSLPKWAASAWFFLLLLARKATMKRHNMNIRRGFSYCFFLRRRIHPLSHWFPDLPCADSCGFPPESPPVAHRTILPHTRRSS